MADEYGFVNRDGMNVSWWAYAHAVHERDEALAKLEMEQMFNDMKLERIGGLIEQRDEARQWARKLYAENRDLGEQLVEYQRKENDREKFSFYWK